MTSNNFAAISSDLDFDLRSASAWFVAEDRGAFSLMKIPSEALEELKQTLGVLIRRCYVFDAELEEGAVRVGRSQEQVLEARLPDRPTVMSGDFGEILFAVYEATRHLPTVALIPKKWRLKEDRNRPSPHSDVLHFLLPTWPLASDQDRLVCSEVKAKATSSSTNPVARAIEGSLKDCTGRLAKTLVWLRERALQQDLGEVGIDHLERFIYSQEHPPYEKHFQAVVCVCSSLSAEVIAQVPTMEAHRCEILVMEVPELRDLYEAAFNSAVRSVSEQDDSSLEER